MYPLVLGSLPVNRYSLASFVALRRIFADRNIILIPSIRTNNQSIEDTIKSLISAEPIKTAWTLEYLQGAREIDLEYMILDYNYYIKRFQGMYSARS